MILDLDPKDMSFADQKGCNTSLTSRDAKRATNLLCKSWFNSAANFGEDVTCEHHCIRKIFS